ncbi:hypothetical protein OIDMADRAFT_31535 [Oidiodendron maius Zn]|uniref:Uncharacterized protein n=1 Tax=Oidiodendron maius (strain Zn) TaxID=913774 RepID=A0A0C3GRT6_OIDMZ|nr:hypothetical protein OIDMADRAFT_31535 [Oidiodendron maius Zn]
MIIDSPMNILDSDKDPEFGELFADDLAVELWVEVGLVVDDKVGPVVDGEVEPALDGEVELIVDGEVEPPVDGEVGLVVDEGIVFVADEMLEDELEVVVPAASY